MSAGDFWSGEGSWPSLADWVLPATNELCGLSTTAQPPSVGWELAIISNDNSKPVDSTRSGMDLGTFSQFSATCQFPARQLGDTIC